MAENEKTWRILDTVNSRRGHGASCIYSRLTDRFRQLTWWQQVLAIAVPSTIYILFAAWVGVTLVPLRIGWGTGLPPNLPIPPNELPALLARWDSFYYLEIATNGYETDASAQAFFPLFPLVVRAINAATGIPFLWAGLGISIFCFVATGLVMYKWLRADYDHHHAWMATALMYIFPVAYYFVGFYAEPIFMLFCVLSLYLARTGRFGASGLGIALAGATRPQAFLLAVPYCLEFYQQRRFSVGNWIQFGIGAVVAPIGTFAYSAYLTQQSYRDAPDTYAGLLREHWSTYLTMPWVTLIDGIKAGAFGINIQPDWFSRAYCIHDLAYALFGLAIAIWAIGRIRASTAGFLLASVLFFYLVHGPYGYAFDSMPRHIASMPPVFLSLALVQDRLPARARWILPAAFVLMLGILAAWFASARWVS